jgi:hypothetical protein
MNANINGNNAGLSFCDETSVKQLMSLLSVSSVQPERFYLTGYETIFFNESRDFLLESVLSSVMSFDKELVILRLSAHDDIYAEICRELDINYRVVDIQNGNIDFIAIEEDLVKSFRASHFLVSGEILKHGEHLIYKLGDLLERYRRCLIVDCGYDPLLMKDVFQFNVDFMIANDNNQCGCSVVVARRSKLVQAEGNARDAGYDLYAHWQMSMKSRGAMIEPMTA